MPNQWNYQKSTFDNIWNYLNNVDLDVFLHLVTVWLRVTAYNCKQTADTIFLSTKWHKWVIIAFFEESCSKILNNIFWGLFRAANIIRVLGKFGFFISRKKSWIWPKIKLGTVCSRPKFTKKTHNFIFQWILRHCAPVTFKMWS